MCGIKDKNTFCRGQERGQPWVLPARSPGQQPGRGPHCGRAGPGKSILPDSAHTMGSWAPREACAGFLGLYSPEALRGHSQTPV